MSHPIRIKKLLESSLPETDLNFTVTFTDKGNLYITNEDGTQRKITDIIVHNTRANFPTYGAPGKIYIDNQDESIYFWALTRYIPIGGDAQTIAASNVVEEVDKRFLKDAERVLIANLTNIKSNVQEQIDAIVQSNQDEALKSNISELDAKITENREAIANTNTEVGNINTKLLTKDEEIAAINTNILGINQSIATTNENVAATNGTLSQEVLRIDGEFQSRDESHTTAIGAINQSIQQLSTDLQGVESSNNFAHIALTYADLLLLTPKEGDTVIVLRDEDVDAVEKPTTFYSYTGSVWLIEGAVEKIKLRDFISNPISLETEVTGVLPKDKYEAQAAGDVAVSNPNFAGKDVNAVLDELFQYANNIKSSVANAVGSPLLSSDTGAQLASKIDALKIALSDAITAKGVGTLATDSLETMAGNVLLIQTSGTTGELYKLTKLNITAPYELKIAPGFDVSVGNVLATLIEHVASKSGIVQYHVGFDNTDATDFVANSNVSYDGTMHLKDMIQHDMIKDEGWIDGGNLHRKAINHADWSVINSLRVINKVVQ